MKKVLSLVLGILISIGGLSTTASASTDDLQVSNEAKEAWYVDTDEYQQFIKGKDYETGTMDSKFYKVTVNNNSRASGDQEYSVEEVSEFEAVTGAMREGRKLLMDGRNSAQETLTNSYFEQTTSVYKWSGGYDVTSAYRWLGILGTNSTGFVGIDTFSSAFSSEFSLDNNAYMVGMTQAEDIYTNQMIHKNRTLKVGAGNVSMQLPYESELLQKNYRGMISYTIVRSMGTAGNVYTAYFDQIKSYNGDISISVGAEGVGGSVSISPADKYKLITALKNNADRNSFVLVNF